MNNLLTLYSPMTILYILEALVLLLIAFLLIFHICFIKKREIAREIFSSVSVQKELNRKKIRIIPVIVILIGFSVISLQYIFEKPQIDNCIEIDVFSSITDENFKVLYHNKNIFDQISGLDNIDTSKIGEYNLTVKIPYLNSSISKDLKLIVSDTQAPVISLEYENNSNVSYTKNLTEQGFTVTDNYDTDLSDSTTVTTEDLGNSTTKVTYTATDSSGNTSSTSIILNIVDDINPSIDLNGYSNISLTVGETYNEQGATAQDEKDGDLTSNIKIDSNVDTSTIGKYTVRYSVIDSSGNTSEVVRIINVVNPDDVKGVIYLTFDDGPSSNITPYILDILKQKGVQATFFILNYSDSNEQFVQREVVEGHSVGIHGYSHSYSEIYTSVEAFMNNVTQLRNKIKNSTGVDTTIMRFPGGSSNTVSKSYCPGIMTTLTKKVIAEGYSYYDWNITSGDSGGAKTSSDVYHNVTKNLSIDKSNIVLMHDFSSNTKTLNALADIIDFGLNNGYRFDKITPSTPMITHHVNN